MRDVYSHRPVEPEELPSVMRKHIYTGAMGVAYSSLIAGIFFTDYGSRAGFSYWHWGIWRGLVTAAMLFQFLGARMTGLFGQRKKLWFRTALAGRLLRGAAIILSFYMLPFSGAAAITVLICLTAVASACGSVSIPPWQSWLSEIIPRDIHGAFMGRRRKWTALAALALAAPCALLVKWMPEEMRMEALLVVFAVGFAIGCIDLYIHRTIPEPEATLTKTRSLIQQIAFVMRDRLFRPVIVFRACWMFSMTLGGSLAMVYFVEDLGFTRKMFVGWLVLSAVPSLATAVSSQWTGGLVDRLGVRKVLLLSHLAWSFLPFCWLLATKETAVYWLIAAAVIQGVGPTAAMLAMSKVTLRFPARSERAMYVAVLSCITGLVGVIAAPIAGLYLEWLRGWSATVLGREVGGFHILFCISLVLRLASTLLAARVPEPRPYSDEFAPV